MDEKIHFDLGKDNWHEYELETLWGERINVNLYKIISIPFFVKGISCGDIVGVTNQAGVIKFTEINKRGGHSTYRIILNEDLDSPSVKTFFEGILALKINYEQGPGKIFSLDIPPEVNLGHSIRYLDIYYQRGLLDFEEGHRGHPL